jgi:hypothetical protein
MQIFLHNTVVASEAKQSLSPHKRRNGLLGRFAPRNDGLLGLVNDNDGVAIHISPDRTAFRLVQKAPVASRGRVFLRCNAVAHCETVN